MPLTALNCAMKLLMAVPIVSFPWVADEAAVPVDRATLSAFGMLEREAFINRLHEADASEALAAIEQQEAACEALARCECQPRHTDPLLAPARPSFAHHPSQ